MLTPVLAVVAIVAAASWALVTVVLARRLPTGEFSRNEVVAAATFSAEVGAVVAPFAADGRSWMWLLAGPVEVLALVTVPPMLAVVARRLSAAPSPWVVMAVGALAPIGLVLAGLVALVAAVSPPPGD